LTSSSMLVERLKSRLGPHKVYSDEAITLLYAREPSGLRGVAPYAVVFPESTEEVSFIVREAYRAETPLYLHGSGSSLSGSAVPLEEGIVVSFERMSSIRELSVVDGFVEAEAGVRLGELNDVLAAKGYMFPVDPASASVATVGGAVNTGAGGLRGAKYGTMRDWVLGVEAVLPDEHGTVLRLGCRLVKCRQGYDLTRLIVGSEGTLAAVTAAVLRITPLPEHVVVAAAFYERLEDLVEASVELRERGLQPLMLEFMDEPSVRAAAVMVKASGGGLEARGHLLLVALETCREAAAERLESLASMLKTSGAHSVYTAISMKEAEERGLLALRRAMYPSHVKLSWERKGVGALVYVEDIAVPPSKLLDAVRGIRQLASHYGFDLMLGGHIGDGNLHPIVAFNPRDRGEAERALSFFEDVMRLAVKLGGTVSAEHGIGVLKREGLRMELEEKGAAKALELMAKIKSVFDPKNILNPHKIVAPSSAGRREWGGGFGAWGVEGAH